MIILEGSDASGKSHLASLISEQLNWPVKLSEGPPRDLSELSDRLIRYSTYPDITVFDRHPAISHQVYGRLRGDTRGVAGARRAFDDLLERSPLIVHCVGKGTHQVKDHDTPEHLAMIDERASQIDSLYREVMALVTGTRHDAFNLTPTRLITYDWDNLDSVIAACQHHAFGKHSWRRCLDVGYVRLLRMTGGSMVLAPASSHNHATPPGRVRVSFEVKAPASLLYASSHVEVLEQVYTPFKLLIDHASTDTWREYIAHARRAQSLAATLTSHGWSDELAQGALPFNVYLRTRMTFDLPELFDFVEAQMCRRSEANQYALAILDLVAAHLPEAVIEYLQESDAFASIASAMVKNIRHAYPVSAD